MAQEPDAISAPAPLPVATVHAVEGASDAAPAAPAPAPRNKVPLGVGASHSSWMSIVKAGQPLTGLPPGTTPRKVSASELAQHNTREDAWTAVHGVVYNIAPYVAFHPGGVEDIMRGAGRDASALFDEFHPWVSAAAMLAPCVIGPLVPDASSSPAEGAAFAARHALGGGGLGFSSAPPAGSVGGEYGRAGTASAAMRVGGAASTLRLLTGDGAWHRVAVKAVTPASKDGSSVTLRCALATRAQTLGLPYAGQHLRVRMPQPGAASGEGESVREYTPVSPAAAAGYFDLAVKCVPGGALSPRLAAAAVGDVLEVSGPAGAFQYTHGVARWGGKSRAASALLLAGAGSGVTPVLQLARAVADDADDATPVHMVVSHSTPAVALLTRELVALTLANDAFRLLVVTSRPDDSAAAGGGGGDGDGAEGAPARLQHSRIQYIDGARLDTAALKAFWPPPEASTVVAWCGPPAFNAAMDSSVRALYYVAGNCFAF